MHTYTCKHILKHYQYCRDGSIYYAIMQSLFLSTQTSFQVVLATNGNESYVILVYSDFSDFARTDYQAAFEAGNRSGSYLLR